MTLISTEKLKNILTLNNVELTTISDETLESWINIKLDEIISLTGLPINPVNRKEIHPRFKGKLLELDFYPVTELIELKINNTILTIDDYVFDENNGIIYFKKHYNGLLTVEYQQGVNESIQGEVNQLIADMITYNLTSKNNALVDGVISSLRESEQSINYDTSNSLGNRIYLRIDELKNKYTHNARVKWI